MTPPPSSAQPPNVTEVSSAAPSRHPIGRFFQVRVIGPLLHLLRVGASPRRLAWSLAVGAVVGINPIVGSTTLVCLAVAFLFRLNLIASQIANHLLFPVQLALVLVYLRAGEMLFRTGPLPLAGDAFVNAMRHHEWSTVRLLWTWQWHAIVVWLILAVVLIPLLAATLHPLLNRLHRSLPNHA